MKKLLSLIICLIIIPVLILGGALAIVYFTYFNPQPAEYQFLHSAEEIVSIEYANVSFEGGNINAEGFGFVTDTEGLMADLAELECHEGVSVDAIVTLASEQTVEGLIVNYSDGSYEIITPYASANSELKIETVEDLLTVNIYGYDVEDFRQLINGYKAADIPLV